MRKEQNELSYEQIRLYLNFYAVVAERAPKHCKYSLEQIEATRELVDELYGKKGDRK